MGESAAGVTVRTFRPEDEESLLRLLIAAFGRWPGREVTVSPAEHLHWKLRSSDEALRGHTVAEVRGSIIGCRLFRYLGGYAEGRPVRACRGFDAAVHPDFRGRGVMTRLRDLALERHRASMDIQLGGYSRIEAMIQVHASEERYPFGNRIEVLERLAGAARPREQAGWAITAPARFDEGIDAFWEQARKQFDFIITRDRSVLNWRYCDVRGGSFLVRTVDEGGAIVAYIAYKRERAKGYIADLLALPGREDALEALVGEALRHFDSEGASAVRCWLPSRHPYRDVLAGHGFTRRRIEKSLRWGPLRTPASELAMLADPQAAIHLTMGDSDLI